MLTLQSDKVSRLSARVVDNATGEELDGVPTQVLYMSGRSGEPCMAYWREGEWVHVEPSPRSLAWHRALGREVRIVRVVEAADAAE